MSFMMVVAVFSVFILGLVLAITGFVGKDPTPSEFLDGLTFPPVDVERRDANPRNDIQFGCFSSVLD